jgi:hypothetical protein
VARLFDGAQVELGRLPLVAAAAGGAISGATTLTFAASGTLTGKGALAGASTLTFAPSGAVIGRAALSGASTLTFSPTATLAGMGSLSGSTTLTFTPTGTLGSVGGGAMSGATTLTFAASGTLTGKGALSGSTSITFTVVGPNQIPVVTVASVGAGGTDRPPRRRWQVEFKGEIREFSTAQEAHEWLAHEIAEDKQERKEEVRQAKAQGRKAPPKPAPKPEITFDGVEVTRWRYQGKSVADQVVSGDYLAKLARHIQERLDDEDDAEAIAVIH